ncbi:MAG: replicative DNA helicase [candidate division Zixibacteria bacterium]|nr:replicative DNA helicase [candidate division Zixibacteria bacterium]
MAEQMIGAERVPPQAVDVEQAVLGAMLLDRDAIGSTIEIIDESSFYKPAHAKIYTAMVSLYDRNEPVDLITLGEELSKRNQLEEVGGKVALLDLADCVATSANVEYHSKIILEKATLRKLIQATTDIITRCYDLTEEVDYLLDSAEQKIFDISEKRVKPGFVSLGDILPHTFESIDKIREGHITGIPTGFKDLDSLTAGLQPADLVVVAGRPSMGKTSFSLSVAEHIAIEEKIPVAIFSLEMAKNQLANRMLCSRARISSHRMRTGRLSDHEWANLSIAAGPLSEAKIFLDDSPGIGILEMRAKARRLKARENIGVIILDYLQLMQGQRGVENRQQEISLISRALKGLAKDLSVPVLALSQLSREVERRGGERRPHLADLRESGAIEQDADMVMFVYRPEMYEINTIDIYGKKENSEGIAEIIVSKHRNGPTGSVFLSFIKDYARFENLEIHRDTPF